MSPIQVRPAISDDAAAIADIWYRGWWDAHRGNVPKELLAVRTEASFVERAWQQVDDSTVAVVDGEVVAFVSVVGDEVELLFVSARHRGSRVAAVLMAEAERQVAANGYELAWLAVVPGNARARRFYERSGWLDAGPFNHLASTALGPIVVPHRRYEKRGAPRSG